MASRRSAKCRFEHGFKLPSPYSRKWPLEVTLARIPAVLYIPVMSKCVACSSSTANFCPKTGPKTKKWCAACCKKNEVPGTFHNPSRKRKAAAGGKAAGGKAAAAARGGGRKKRPRSASWDLDESLNEHNERRDSTDSTSADGLFGGYRSSRQDADDEDDEQDDEHDEDDEQDVCEDCDSQPAVSALPAEMEPRWCEGCAGAHDGATTEYGEQQVHSLGDRDSARMPAPPPPPPAAEARLSYGGYGSTGTTDDSDASQGFSQGQGGDMVPYRAGVVAKASKDGGADAWSIETSAARAGDTLGQVELNAEEWEHVLEEVDGRHTSSMKALLARTVKLVAEAGNPKALTMVARTMNPTGRLYFARVANRFQMEEVTKTNFRAVVERLSGGTLVLAVTRMADTYPGGLHPMNRAVQDGLPKRSDPNLPQQLSRKPASDGRMMQSWAVDELDVKGDALIRIQSMYPHEPGHALTAAQGVVVLGHIRDSFDTIGAGTQAQKQQEQLVAFAASLD